MQMRLFLTTAIIIAGVCGISAQSGTADGVAALARGDYQRAVEILKPIAENWRTDDTAAQFFMAGLYETGRGVPVDPLRACALYTRAMNNHDAPFGRQASALLDSHLARGAEFNEECQLLANIGFDHGFEPVTFHLGPGYFVEWTLTTATVTYAGRTNHEQMSWELNRGARFLPLRHTELATGPARSDTRHFIEIFVWQPPIRSGPWTLQWHLFEVGRGGVIQITTPEWVAAVEGDAPPANGTFDVRQFAELRVDDEGNTEWAVLKGAHRAAERIASEAERREVREQDRARAEARKAVDWDRRYDVYRQPTMTYVDADGCGHVHLYGWTADRAEAILVGANGHELGLSTQPATFDLSRDAVNISVETHVYARPQHEFRFCFDDIVRRPAPGSIEPETWRAVAGTITIQLPSPGVRSHAPYLRRATVTLTDLVLRNSAGTTVKASRPVTLTAVVGAMGG